MKYLNVNSHSVADMLSHQCGVKQKIYLIYGISLNGRGKTVAGKQSIAGERAGGGGVGRKSC